MDGWIQGPVDGSCRPLMHPCISLSLMLPCLAASIAFFVLVLVSGLAGVVVVVVVCRPIFCLSQMYVYSTQGDRVARTVKSIRRSDCYCTSRRLAAKTLHLL